METDHKEKSHDQSKSSSDSDTSSSSSKAEIRESTKFGQLQNDLGSSEEVFVGWTTHIQPFALIHLSVPGAPTLEGIAWCSMCGARLNSHMQFSDHPKAGLSFCRKPACMKACSMMESG